MSLARAVTSQQVKSRIFFPLSKKNMSLAYLNLLGIFLLVVGSVYVWGDGVV
jgi:hypothetical protein